MFFKPREPYRKFKERMVNPSDEFLIPVKCGFTILDLHRDQSRDLDIFVTFQFCNSGTGKKHKS